MTPQQLLRGLADMSVEDIGSVVDALAAGAWDEWDCDFGTFVELFGAQEWKFVAQSAADQIEEWANKVPPPCPPVKTVCIDCERCSDSDRCK